MTEKKLIVVALDETRGLDDNIRSKVGRLMTLYVYDPERSVHCCEVTPSREMVQFDFSTMNEVDDELYSELMAGFAQAEETSYMHCRVVDNLDPKYRLEIELDLDEDEICEFGYPGFADLAVKELRANPQYPPVCFS
jgi:hypothetical protein